MRPNSSIALRKVKAEGGWGVVCTEYCSIHPTSDDLPLPFASLWDDDDVRAQALMVDKVHRHGSLAGVELWHGGGTSANLYTREGATARADDIGWTFPDDFEGLLDRLRGDRGFSVPG